MKISIDQFFKVLNLTVSIGLAIYLIKRYVLVRIKNMIFQEKQTISDLKNQHVQLKESCQKISEQIERDEKDFAELSKKFEIWHEKIKEQEMQEQNLCMQRQQKIENSMLQKMNYLQRQKFMASQVPALLSDALQALQKKFDADKSLGKKYQTKLLDVVRKLH